MIVSDATALVLAGETVILSAWFGWVWVEGKYKSSLAQLGPHGSLPVQWKKRQEEGTGLLM